jgi:hypothetical protein
VSGELVDIKKRVAIRRRFGHDFRADTATGAWAIEDHDRLAPCSGQPGTKQARDQINGSPGCVGNDDLDRAIRVFGVRCSRSGGQEDGKRYSE